MIEHHAAAAYHRERLFACASVGAQLAEQARSRAERTRRLREAEESAYLEARLRAWEEGHGKQ